MYKHVGVSALREQCMLTVFSVEVCLILCKGRRQKILSPQGKIAENFPKQMAQKGLKIVFLGQK